MTTNLNYKFSIIIPTYNCAEYLPVAINSLLNQDYGYQDLEIVVVDDGSTDNTSFVVQTYLEKYPNNIFYYKKTNGNWGSVINYVKANKLVHGKLITVLDSDDFFSPNAFGKVSVHLNEDMVVCSFYCLTGEDKIVLDPFFGRSRLITKKQKLRTPHSQPLAKFYSNNLFYSLNNLTENVWYQDCIMYHNAVSKAKSVFYIREPLATWFSVRPGNSTSMPWSNDLKFEAWCNTLKKMCLNGAGVVVYVYTLLPGFIEALKERNRIIELPCRPSYTWLPWIFAPFFNAYVRFKTRKIIKYPRKRRSFHASILGNKKMNPIVPDHES
ncbi:glycosyltransferase family 2 protein [[Mycoplasma] testudinis]|uniref:glycosyltransferase family 2 protein n=1 Tax=[Mycoplasma] testudinis TaxID=33924 RepID=UPI0009FEF6A0|nr:glycosyltransferase family 2 protein [[Mycoplasma] testudinis]